MNEGEAAMETHLEPLFLFLAEHRVLDHLRLDRDARQPLEPKPNVSVKFAVRLHTRDGKRRLEAHPPLALVVEPGLIGNDMSRDQGDVGTEPVRTFVDIEVGAKAVAGAVLREAECQQTHHGVRVERK